MGANCVNISKAFGAASSCKNNMGGVKNLWIAPTPEASVILPKYPVPFEQLSTVDEITDVEPMAALWVTGTAYTAGTLLKETANGVVHSVDADYTSGSTFAGDVTAGDLVVYGNTKFYKFPLPIDLGDYVEDVTADPKLGVSFVTITINGTLLGLSHDTSTELSKIMQGQQTLVAELYDGRYVLLGEANGMDLTGGGSRSGAEASSLQGYEVTWTGKEPHYARFIDETNVVTATAGQITVVTP